MSSEITQRFFILAIIVTLSISVWSGYLYSQTYRISQESKLELEAAKKKLIEVEELLSEANSKLETASELFSEASKRLQEAHDIQEDTKKLLTEMFNQTIINVNFIDLQQKPEIHHLHGEKLLTSRLLIEISSPSKYPIYYESSIVDIPECIIKVNDQPQSFTELVRVSNVQNDLEMPVWDNELRAIGTNNPKVALWIGLRGLAFQRQGILLPEPDNNTTVLIKLQIKIVQAHTDLVMNQETINITFQLSPEAQRSIISPN
ncbi:hypothetical protein [[Eubacterium] cellulosolvens]